MALRKSRGEGGKAPAKSAGTSSRKVLDSRPSRSSVAQRVRDTQGASVEVPRQDARIERIMLSSIRPDPDNQRTWYINYGTINLLRDAFTNSASDDPSQMDIDPILKQIAGYAADQGRNLPHQDEVVRTVEGLVGFATHLKKEPLLQPFGVTPTDAGISKVVYGNRRFIASYIAHGGSLEIECLKYVTDPETKAVKRFVENSQREDLSLSAKLADFASAFNELSELDPGAKNYEIASRLGLSRSMLQKYLKILRCDALRELVDGGLVPAVPFAYDAAVLADKDPGLFVLVCDALAQRAEPAKGEFKQFLSIVVESGAPGRRAQNKSAGRGRPAKVKFPSVGNPRIIEKLFAPGILASKEWQGIDLSNTDKKNISAIEKLIVETVKKLVAEITLEENKGP